ncbi:MAG: hypothetical protein M3Z36_13995 [Acidobacteriota bacterium]|nr:hypothetical protein [Acidobacteriota bacterium]
MSKPLLIAIAFAASAFAAPVDFVPIRWNWTEPKTLDLLSGTPVNCVLLNWKTEDAVALGAFASAAAQRGITPLAVIRPGGDPLTSARAAIQAKLQGIVLEGDFPNGAAARVRDGLADSHAIIIELTARNEMKLGGNAPVIGTYQGVWAGIQVTPEGAAKAGPSGSAWIDTNSGFLRAARAWGNSTVWIGNVPPPKTVVTGERYLQAIGDAAMVGARWVVAFDEDFGNRLNSKDSAAINIWKRMAQLLQFYEDHREWRALEPAGKLAVVQDRDHGALLSGGILDMIAVRHTPVRAIPPQRLSPDALKGATMAVDVDAGSLTPQQTEILTTFRKTGGTVLTAPPGWKDAAPNDKNRITLDEKEVKRLDDIWHDVQSMIGRKNLGARLFNVSSMLSNLAASPDGKQVVVQLVNYSEFPVENVTVHVLGNYTKARLYTPEGKMRELEAYKNDEGTGVDIDKVAVCAALQLE